MKEYSNTFDSLPASVGELHRKINNIERLLIENSQAAQPEPDRWLDLNELVEYDPEKRSKPTFYGYIQSRKIPFYKKGKKVIFLKSEIDLWLKGGRKRTNDELTTEASEYLRNKKGGVQ